MDCLDSRIALNCNNVLSPKENRSSAVTQPARFTSKICAECQVFTKVLTLLKKLTLVELRVEKVVTRLIMTFGQLCRVVGWNWGIIPQVTFWFWFYIVIIKPRVPYVSLICWLTISIERNHHYQRIAKIQRLDCKDMTWSMRITQPHSRIYQVY